MSLSSHGTVLTVGGPSGTTIGSIHVCNYFDQDNSLTKLDDVINSEASNDSFGFSVSLSSDGKVLAVGAKSNDKSSGCIFDNYGMFGSTHSTIIPGISLVVILTEEQSRISFV